MATSNFRLDPPPFQVPIFDPQTGIMNPVWQAWFNKVWVLVR